MTWDHTKAVFLAEYNTTTSKLRNIRKYIPIVFLLGVFVFSFVLRLFYEILLNDQEFVIPDIARFYSIIAIFSYYTLFAPLLSPLGRVVYDGSGRSRREVALSTPVTNSELLYGNLISNLVFYLPFFGFVGTVMLAPFFGSGKFSPGTTALILFLVLSLLILIGLIVGSLVAPIVTLYFSKSKSNIGKAIVMIGISIMLVTSLPLFQFLVNQSQENSGFGIITVLPFTIAASIIIYVLYDIQIGISIFPGFVLLCSYLIGIMYIGHISADRLYSISENENQVTYGYPDAFSSKFTKTMTILVPKHYRLTTRVIYQASIRDIEQISRITIGIAITIFLVFAFSDQGLFEDTVGLTDEIRASMLTIAVIVSAGTVIFIESSAFVVQHRSLLEIIKSAPSGPKKFVVSKIIQVNLLILPLYTLFLASLFPLGFLDFKLALRSVALVLVILNTLISICLCIYLVNPIDNEEDLGNFVNLIVFYIFLFALVVPLMILSLSGYSFQWYHYISYVFILILLSILATILSVNLLDQLNVENLKSDLSQKITQSAKSLTFLFLAFNILPIFVLPVLLYTKNLLLLLVVTDLLILLIPLTYWKMGEISLPRSNFPIIRNLRSTFQILIAMFLSSLLLLLLFIPSTSINSPVSLILELPIITLLIFLILQVCVEEIFFRWFLYDYSKKKIGIWGSRILNAILFGIVHLYPLISLINAIIQAIWLTILRDKTNSIYYPILAHIIFNLTVIILSIY